MFKRIFLLVMDGCGIGNASDASEFDDEGANTLLHTLGDSYNLDILETLGLTSLIGKKVLNTRGFFMECESKGKAKDSLNGHLEMMGVISDNPFKVYKKGFPKELIDEIEKSTGYSVIGNVAADGHKIIEELGEMQIKNNSIIIYTSADSVLQIAAHEDSIPVETLYKICEKVRFILDKGDYQVARVIARPFIGKEGIFVREDSKRKDYVCKLDYNVLNLLSDNNVNTIGVGKIIDLFSESGLNVKLRTNSNVDTMLKVVDFAKGDFSGLLFANFNDFDSKCGHRRDKDAFIAALEEFNFYLPILLKNLKKDDLLIITADHGNDPTYKGSDHTKENVPILIFNRRLKLSKQLGKRETLADVGATILDNFQIKNPLAGESIFEEMSRAVQ